MRVLPLLALLLLSGCASAPDPQCDDDADCPAGDVCSDGRCDTPAGEGEGEGEGGGCNGDVACPPDSVCVDGACARVCASSADCDAGLACVDGVCG